MSVTTPAADELHLRRLLRPRLEALVGLGLEHVQVLVQVGREQEELGVLHLERPAGVGDAALAQEDHLPAGFEGATDGRPFLEGDLE